MCVCMRACVRVCERERERVNACMHACVCACMCLCDVFKNHCFRGPAFGKFHKYDVLEIHLFIAFQTIPLHHSLIPGCAEVSAFPTVCYT